MNQSLEAVMQRVEGRAAGRERYTNSKLDEEILLNEVTRLRAELALLGSPPETIVQPVPPTRKIAMHRFYDFILGER